MRNVPCELLKRVTFHAWVHALSRLDEDSKAAKDEGEAVGGGADGANDDARLERRKRARIVRQGVSLLGLGSLIIILISDPFVSTITKLSQRIGISSFLLSLTIVPVASNASEMVGSIVMASKKVCARAEGLEGRQRIG